MANAKIDANYQGTALAVTNTDATIKNLLVDSVTGYLLVAIVFETTTDVAVSTKIDANYEGVAMGVTNDSNLTPKPLKVQATSGALLVDIA